MSKGTTIKEAIFKFEEKEGKKASESKEVKLISQSPPIEKMDASLSTLTCCEKLCLSTNAIEKIANLNGLKHLKILSLGRNNIKSLTGLEAVGETLEQLWISYNSIEKLKGLNVLKKLEVLYMANNQVKDEGELSKLGDLPCLREFVFVGNPLQENWPEGLLGYEDYFQVKFPRIKKLDGNPLVKNVDQQDQQLQGE